jgi:hypothetical protein
MIDGGGDSPCFVVLSQIFESSQQPLILATFGAIVLKVVEPTYITTFQINKIVIGFVLHL